MCQPQLNYCLLCIAIVAYTDKVYHTKFSCKAEAQLKDKLSWLGGWVGGGAAREMKNKAKPSLNRVSGGRAGLVWP